MWSHIGRRMMDYQLILPGFENHFNIRRYLKEIDCWGVLISWIAVGLNVYRTILP